MTTKLIVQIEITDTMNGDANYAWVKRSEIRNLENKSDLAIVKAVKKQIGWSNIRCRVERYGDLIRLSPFKDAVTCFITFHTYGSAS